MRRWLRAFSAAGVVLAVFSTRAGAADVTVLSAAAVRPALSGLLANWSHETGHRVTVSYGAAEEIRQRLVSGERVDLVIMPRSDFEDVEHQGLFRPGARRDLAAGRTEPKAQPIVYSAAVRQAGPSAGVAGMLLDYLAGRESRAAFGAQGFLPP